MNNQDNKPAQVSTNYSSLALKQILSLNWQQILDASQNDKPHAGRVFREFIQLVESNHRTQHSPKFYADKLNMTKSNLGKICQKVIGYPPSHCIQIRLMLEAYAMIKDTKHIKEIVFKLGFEDPKHFTKFFKKHSGLPPESYRNLILKPSDPWNTPKISRFIRHLSRFVRHLTFPMGIALQNIAPIAELFGRKTARALLLIK